MSKLTHRLLDSKVRVPPLRDGTVLRPRIDRDLDAAARVHPIVLVVAAPGAGKTTAVAQYVAATDRPVAWLTLDESDTQPGRFVTYLAHAIGTTQPELARTVIVMLRDGLAATECAAILSECIAPRSIVVLDDLHHLTGEDAVLRVLRGFVRHLDNDCRLLLVSRRLPALGLERDALAARVGGVFDHDLAFTPDETAQLLELRGIPLDPQALHHATGGWAAGLVFDSLAKSTERPVLPPGEDPLFAYLGAEIFEGLADPLRGALLRTSVLDVVTPARVVQLLDDAAGEGIFDELSRQHLPATAEIGSLRYHPRFREFLLHRLRAESPDEVPELTARFGRMLAADGYLEEAVDALLAAGQTEEAEPLVGAATGLLMSRGDWDKVIGWSEALGETTLRKRAHLRGAQIRALLLARQQRRVESLVHGMLASGEIGELASSSPDVVGWAVWALHASGEWAKLLPLLPADSSGRIGVVRHLFRVSASPEPPPELPPQMLDKPQPFHVALQSALYYQGRFDEVERLAAAAATRGPVTQALGQIYRIAVLRERGDLAGARDCLDAVALRVRASRYLEFWHQVEGELAFAEGHEEDGLGLVREARRLSKAHLYRIGDQAIFAATEGKLLTQMGRYDDAIQLLETTSAWCAERGLLSFQEWADTWLGAALLLRGDDPQSARRVLAPAVGGMARATRRLELSTAAVVLAEAEWRLGNEEAHDAACDLALATAASQGTLAPLVRALERFPDVLRRRVDAAGEASDPWRALLQTTTAQPTLPVLGHTPIRLRTFGTAAIEVHGTPTRVGLGKAIELAVYLAGADQRGISRDWLAREAFGGGESGQNYLRQTIHRLRRILPPGVELHSAGGQLSWVPVDAATTDDRVFEGLIARARVEVGARRLDTLREALVLVDAGPYLPELDTAAIASRRRDLDELEAEARADLARGLIEIGDPAAARDMIRTALRRDPLREDVWQLLMRAEDVLGGPEAVGRVLVECRDALARAGLEPCTTTIRTAERLRRVDVAASA